MHGSGIITPQAVMTSAQHIAHATAATVSTTTSVAASGFASAHGTVKQSPQYVAMPAAGVYQSQDILQGNYPTTPIQSSVQGVTTSSAQAITKSTGPTQTQPTTSTASVTVPSPTSELG